MSQGRIPGIADDELGQDLTVLKYQMRFIEKRLRKDQKVLRDACADTLQHIDDLVENIRRISRNLSPYNLQQLGLTASIQLIATEFSKHTSTEVSLDIENIDDLLSRENGTVRCSVRDDGIGFSVADARIGISQTSGIGLATMEERARMIGGSLEIGSQKGEGTRILLRIPIHEKGGS
ncbi:MAG: sensor histidine kinase [Syntrophobacteraceae bacterium]